MSAEQARKYILWGKKGCSYCERVKGVLAANDQAYAIVDVEGRDDLRDILELKYGTRLVPVVEVQNRESGDGVYEAYVHTELDRFEALFAESAQVEA
ncbi:NrdH-redoxin [Cohnella faecalis]|uniref:NrdH-redoxin n=1 Tax=Cohnella faecalis TaxID=2315694 RepID=A0A398CR55_9BACL|nr:glutaredoxin domain-containing protein [Cohnella faecalis]RIE01911.1 NrdH-redoxin [Cohnella faecalis]